MKVLTANRLTDGEAVWYSLDGWSRQFDGVEVARDADAESRLASIGALAYANNEVVDVNLIDVTDDHAKPQPVRLRERIRADGPTIDYVGKPAI